MFFSYTHLSNLRDRQEIARDDYIVTLHTEKYELYLDYYNQNKNLTYNKSPVNDQNKGIKI